MHHLICTETVPLTPELAANFAGLPSFKGDRQRDSSAGMARIAWLERILHEGKFHTPKWATAELDGIMYRVNGGHSSMMLATVNGDFPKGMVAVIDRFRCETRDDLADLFDQFDNRHSIRSGTDKINAHKGVYDDMDSVSPTDVNRAISGIAYFLTDDGQQRRLDEEERIRLIHQYRPFILWAAQFTGRRQFSGVGVVAAIFATWSRSPRLATEFWTQVAEESHPDNWNGSRVLAAFLRDNIGRRKFGTSTPLYNQRVYYVKSIHGWNAWRRNATTDLKYHENCQWPRLV